MIADTVFIPSSYSYNVLWLGHLFTAPQLSTKGGQVYV